MGLTFGSHPLFTMMLKICLVLLVAIALTEAKAGKKNNKNVNPKNRYFKRQAASCAANEFTCTSGQCIQSDWTCDTEKDCTDGSDEVNCHKVQCPQGEVQCDNYLCIEAAWVCDGDT